MVCNGIDDAETFAPLLIGQMDFGGSRCSFRSSHGCISKLADSLHDVAKKLPYHLSDISRYFLLLCLGPDHT